MDSIVSQIISILQKLTLSQVHNLKGLKVLGLIVPHLIITNLVAFNNNLNLYLNRIFLSRIKINLLDLILLDKSKPIQTHSNQLANFKCLQI